MQAMEGQEVCLLYALIFGQYALALVSPEAVRHLDYMIIVGLFRLELYYSLLILFYSTLFSFCTVVLF